MTIYAFRIGAKILDLPRSQCLTEFATLKAFNTAAEALRDRADGGYLTRCSASRAHDWVRRGELHETALWTDGRRIRRAGPGI